MNLFDTNVLLETPYQNFFPNVALIAPF